MLSQGWKNIYSYTAKEIKLNFTLCSYSAVKNKIIYKLFQVWNVYHVQTNAKAKPMVQDLFFICMLRQEIQEHFCDGRFLSTPPFFQYSVTCCWSPFWTSTAIAPSIGSSEVKVHRAQCYLLVSFSVRWHHWRTQCRGVNHPVTQKFNGVL